MPRNMNIGSQVAQVCAHGILVCGLAVCLPGAPAFAAEAEVRVRFRLTATATRGASFVITPGLSQLPQYSDVKRIEVGTFYQNVKGSKEACHA